MDDLNEAVKNFNCVYEIGEKDKINERLKKIIFNCSENNCSANNVITILKEKFKTYQVFKRDRFENIFYYYLFSSYYLLRFYYRKFFTKQDKVLIALITQKLKRLDLKEIEETVKDYSSGLKIDERTLNIKEIYPQVFKIESKNNL